MTSGRYVSRLFVCGGGETSSIWSVLGAYSIETLYQTRLIKNLYGIGISNSKLHADVVQTESIRERMELALNIIPGLSYQSRGSVINPRVHTCLLQPATMLDRMYIV